VSGPSRGPASAAAARVALRVLTPAVRGWVTDTFGTLTPPQAAAIPAIHRGEHVLISAPTGTGKTLAAFLAVLSELVAAHDAGTLGPGIRSSTCRRCVRWAPTSNATWSGRSRPSANAYARAWARTPPIRPFALHNAPATPRPLNADASARYPCVLFGERLVVVPALSGWAGGSAASRLLDAFPRGAWRAFPISEGRIADIGVVIGRTDDPPSDTRG
jgi:hypothetical protein